MTVLISAGHNPRKPGACFEGSCEHEEAVLWASELQSALDSVQVCAELVPTGSLKNKVAWINQRNPVLALEIHFNSSPQRQGQGCETLIFPNSKKGLQFGGAVQDAMSGVMGVSRGVKPGYLRLNSKNPVLYFLRKVKAPALILEPEFIQNIELIRAKRRKCCEAIAEALQDSLPSL